MASRAVLTRRTGRGSGATARRRCALAPDRAILCTLWVVATRHGPCEPVAPSPNGADQNPRVPPPMCGSLAAPGSPSRTVSVDARPAPPHGATSAWRRALRPVRGGQPRGCRTPEIMSTETCPTCGRTFMNRLALGVHQARARDLPRSRGRETPSPRARGPLPGPTRRASPPAGPRRPAPAPPAVPGVLPGLAPGPRRR